MGVLLYLLEREHMTKCGTVSFVLKKKKINACAVKPFQFCVSVRQEINVYVYNMIQPLTFEPNAGHEMDSPINTGKPGFYLPV